MSTGFSMKLYAPAFMASTARLTLPWPVIMMTSALEAACLNRVSSSVPSTSGSFESINTICGFQLSRICSAATPSVAVCDEVTAVLEQEVHPFERVRMVIDNQHANRFRTAHWSQAPSRPKATIVCSDSERIVAIQYNR